MKFTPQRERVDVDLKIKPGLVYLMTICQLQKLHTVE